MTDPLIIKSSLKPSELVQASEAKKERISQLSQQLRAGFQGFQRVTGTAPVLDSQATLERVQTEAALRAEEMVSAAPRTGAQLARDIPLDLLSGTSSLLTSLGQLSATADPVGRVAEQVLPDSWTEEHRRNRQRLVEGLGRLNEAVSDTALDSSSDIRQASRRFYERQQAADMYENAQAVEKIKDTVIGQVQREVMDFADTGENLLNNPTELGGLVVQQVPNIAATVATGGLVGTARAGATSVGGRTLSRELVAEAERKLRDRVAVGTIVSMESAGTYQQSYMEIQNTPIEQLQQRFPEIKERLAAGEDPELVRAELADQVGLTAAGLTAPVAVAAGRMVAGFERAPFAANGSTPMARVASGLGNIGKEGTEELIQSTSSETAGNAARMLAGDVDQQLLEGTGSAGAEGGLAGTFTAGTLQAPALAANASLATADLGLQATKETLAAGLDLAGAGMDRLLRVGESRLETLQAPAREQAQAAAERRQEVATAVEEELQAQGQALPEDGILTPAERTELGAEGLGKVATLARVIEAAKVEEDPKKAQLYHLFATRTARELRQAQVGLESRINNETDPAAKERLEKLNLAINELANSEDMLAAEEELRKVPEEAIQEVFSRLPEDIATEGVEVPAEVAQTIEFVREMAYAAPDKITTENATRATALFQKLREKGKGPQVTEEDVKQLELVLEVNNIQDQHAKKLEQITERTKFKTQDVVSTEINETGFGLGKTQKKSVKQYVRDISAAIASGEVQVAAQQMRAMAAFATGLRNKANAFDTAAKAQIDAGPAAANQWFDVQGTRQLAAQNRLGNEMNRVNLSNDKSVGLIDAVFADASTVGKAFNALVQRFPQIAQSLDITSVDVTDAPSWKKYVPAPKAVELIQESTDVPVADATGSADPAAGRADRSEVASRGEDAAQEIPAAAADEVDAASVEAQSESAPSETADVAAEAPALAVDFQAPAPAEAESQLAQALAMSEQEYLATVNPEGKVTEVPSDEAIDAELADTEPSSRATQVGQVGDVTLMADGDYLYAVRGEDTVGLLVSKDGGSQLYVASSERGKGLGKALVRELLVRKPLAPTNGLSPAAQATRLAVLRDLRAERTPTMEKRFSGVANLPEATEADVERQVVNLQNRIKKMEKKPGPVLDGLKERLARMQSMGLRLVQMMKQNQWLQAFRLNPEHKGIMSQGGLGELPSVLETTSGLLTSELKAINTIVNDIVPFLVRELNKQLQAKAENDNRLLGDDPQLWQNPDKFSLHATNYGRIPEGGKLEYDSTIAQGVALAASLWLMENINKEFSSDLKYVAQFLGKREDEVTPAERYIFQTSQIQDAMVTEVARMIPQILGVRVVGDAPATATDGIVQALAADVLKILIDNKDVIQTKHFVAKSNEGNRIISADQVEAAKAAGAEITQFIMLSFEREGSAQELRKELGVNGARALSKILDPSRVQSWDFSPGEVAERTVRGSDQQLSPIQKDILKQQNQVAFYRNTEMLNWLMRLGKDQALRLFGYVEFDPEKTNKVDAVRLRGINLGLERSWDALVEWNSALEREAERLNVAPEEVPTHFQHYLTSNNRVMMEGAVNPQSNKLLREVMVATRSEMDIGNEQDEVALRLMVGQAIGLKIENAKNHQEIVEEVDKRMGENGMYYPVWTALLQEDMNSATFIEQMELAGFATDGSAVKAFHAMQTWAAYDRAKNAGQEKLTTYLAFEQDGKTDGPANAMAQLGLHDFNELYFENLARAGYYVNREETALGDTINEKGDLYQRVADGAQALFAKKIQNLREKLKNAQTGPEVRALSLAQGTGLVGALTIFSRLKNITMGTEDGVIDAVFKRGFAKQPVTSTGYSGGVAAIAGSMVQQTTELLYGAMSVALENDTVIDEGLANSINSLVTTTLEWVKRGDKRVLVARQTSAPIDFSKRESYQGFELRPHHIRAMNSHLKEGFAKMLRESIKNEMSSTLAGMNAVVTAAQTQTLVMAYEFEKAYKAELEKQIAEGNLLPEQTLSRAQEKKLLAGLKILAPVTQFSTTVDVGNRSVGLNMAQVDRSSVFEDESGPRRVTSIAGDLTTKIGRMGFKDPGVRAGALTIISAGDATMMANYFLDGMRQALNVWDGLEVGLKDLFKSAPEINKAVYRAWQFDLLGNINKQFQESLPELLARIEQSAELAEYIRKMHKLDKETTAEEFVTSFGQMLDNMATKSRVTKEVLNEYGMSIDHMAGARRPFVRNGKVVDSPTEFVDVVANEVDRRINGDRKSAEVESLRYDAAVQLMEEKLAKDPSRIRQFVWKQIKPLLSADLVMHIGGPSEIRAKIREVFPDAQLPVEMPVGAYLNNQIFTTTKSTETLLHELVHAAVTNLIDRAYANGKGLTFAQKQAVMDLQKLAEEFLTLDAESMDPATGASVMDAQSAISELMTEGDTAGAVNEFLAWTLSNEAIAEKLKKEKAPTGLTALAKRIVATVRRLLGLPSNVQIDSFMEQVLGQFVRVTRVGKRLDQGSDRILFQQLRSSGSAFSEHTRHLDAVYEELEQVLSAVPEYMRSSAFESRFREAIRFAEEQVAAFLNAGFRLSQKEQAIFGMTQAMFASDLRLDPRATSAMQVIYEAAAKEVLVEDFMVDSQSTDPNARRQAQDQWNALFGNSISARDAKDRSTQLANFVALALVHEPLRQKLRSLSMPKPVEGKKTADDQLRTWTTRIFNRLSNASLGLSPNVSQGAAIDVLMTRLAKLQVKWAKTARMEPNAFERLEAETKARLSKVGDKAGQLMVERQARGQLGGVNGLVNGFLNSVRALTNDDLAEDFGEDVLATTSGMWKEFRELFAEMVGGTKTNRPIHELLNQARSKVAQVRQRLREEAPEHVRSLFTRKLSEQTWARLVRSVGKTDLQALLGNYNGNRIQEFLEDVTKLQAEIQALSGQLSSRPEVLDSVDNLAHYLMTGEQLNGKGPLYRNAEAIAMQPGFGKQTDRELNRVQTIVDRLVTLKAMTYLDAHESSELAELFRTERKGIEGVVRIMRQRVRMERAKTNAPYQRLNYWKGYVPVSMDPRREVVLAGPERGKQLLALGYTKLMAYAGDAADPNKNLAYYTINAGGGRTTFNQGALQTVEGSIMGVDHITGTTLDPSVKTVITDERAVGRITAMKKTGLSRNSGEYALLPIFNTEGEVVAYERPLSKALLDQHLIAKPDLAQSIGMWMGRQAEEALATEFNGQVVTVLKKIWDDHKNTSRANEFVDVSGKGVPASVRDAWNTIPRDTQRMLKDEFRGPVMVRLDMLNNALGYRSATIADAFLGMGDLPEDIRDGIVKVSAALLGKNAYRWLVAGERAWQGVVGAAKDVIVVRSGVVALANGISNQFQLLMHGVPMTRLLQIQAGKVVETETYLRNAHRIARIQVELDSTVDPQKRRKLEQEQQGLHDQNRRLTIWPLIQAGELPTIAEGLTEQDEYTLLGDGMEWLRKKTQNLPEGVITAAKYAVISKDTALYQGMNRLIQFGDFMAKAALFDHLVQQKGLSEAEALRIISERFVNYNLLAGRTRDYLESMGLTWFMNYKLRIQKVVLSTIRENPLRFLMAGVGADWLGADSLLSSSAPLAHWEPAVGPGMMFRADNALMWNQLMQ